MKRNAIAFVLLAAACGGGGDDGNSASDGGADGQGNGDADVNTPVTLTVTTATGAPKAGVRVHFQNPDSTLVSSATTDAAGVATAIMPSGGYVTAIDPYSTANSLREIRTFAGVKPGDALQLRAPSSGGEAVQVTGAKDTQGSAVGYAFETPCGDMSAGFDGAGYPTASIGFSGACLPTTDILEYAYDVEGSMTHWGYLANAAVTSSTLDAKSLPMTSVPGSKSLTFTNKPASFTTFTYSVGWLTAAGLVAKFDLQNLLSNALQTTPIASSKELVDVSGVTDHSTQRYIEWEAAPGTTAYSADVGSKLLRLATQGASYDEANKRLVWTEAQAGLAPDWGVTLITGTPGGGATTVEWALAGPASNQALQFPTLPVETTDYNFQASDEVGSMSTLVGRSPGGYDAVRAHLIIARDRQDISWFVAGASAGLVSLQAIDQAAPN